MYFVEKINEGDGKLICHKYVDKAGKNQTSSVALCYSEETASFITNFLNVYENFYMKEEFTRVIKEFITIFSQFLQENENKKKTYSEMDSTIEILSFLTNMGRTYEKIKNIFPYQIEGFFNNLERIMYKQNDYTV